MGIMLNLWISFNIVFGLWSLTNWVKYFYYVVTNRKFDQSNLGKMLDLVILCSILTYVFSYHSILFDTSAF